jgi:hypothetical protein
MKSRLRLAFAYVRHLGIRWAAFRLRYEAERRTGRIERRTPITPWPAAQPGRPAPPLARPIVAKDELATWLRAGVDASGLEARVDAIRTGCFDVFGTRIQPTSWRHDPLSAVHYPDGVHWTRGGEQPDADVKLVWEPSRFAWCFDLVRAQLVRPELDAGALFWALFENWCEANPPNTGVQWSCGQEAAIRLIAVVIAADALRDRATPAQIARYEAFVDATARRILGNIGYARSQKNNHWVSEAVGLVTAAAVLPSAPSATQAWRVGTQELAKACEQLVFADGGTSQYSMNYHRVFMHDLAWALIVTDRAGRSLPVAVREALRRATGLLGDVIVSADGQPPWFGNDDGANVLPLASEHHQDMRSTLQLANTILTGRPPLAEGPWDEPVVWFYGTAPLAHRTAPKARPAVRIHPDMGVAVVERGDHSASIRAVSHRFRPAHADQAHVDVWFKGRAVALDAGTFSYKAPGWDTPFGDTSAHNTVTVDGLEQMERLTRFFWAPWSSGCYTTSTIEPPSVTVVHDSYERRPVATTHQRTLAIGTDGVIVTDLLRSSRPHRYRVHWLLADLPFELSPAGDSAVTTLDDARYRVRWWTDGAIEDVSLVRGDAESGRGWVCATYRNRQPACSLAIVVRGTGAVSIQTSFGPAAEGQ